MKRVNEPRAPRDPAKKRPAVYLMLDNRVEGRPDGNGGFRDVCYLEGRVAAKLTSVLPELNQELAEKLQECCGFRELVHSIGISATAKESEERHSVMAFSLNCRAGEGGGTSYRCQVPCDGREVTILLEDVTPSTQDTVLASIIMEFPKYMTAKVTVVCYLKEGISVPELTIDHPVDFESEAYRRLVEGSLLHRGNLYRVQKAIDRAKKGEDVTVAFIGGSITQGAAAKPIGTESYAYRAYSRFRNRFGARDGSNIHFVKAGVGGTSSELGVTRYERDLLRNGLIAPDLVIIEYAVNDLGDETEGVCYESLVLKAMEGPGAPGVILLFSVFMDDWNLQERLSQVGYHYDLPMISIKDAVVPQFYDKHPVITKRQYFYDLFHPTNEGHRIMADCLDYFWQQADSSEREIRDVNLDRDPAIGNTYRRLKTFTRDTVKECGQITTLEIGSFTERDRELQCVELDDHAYTTPEFADNWMFAGDGQGKPLCLTITCKDLLLIYKDSGDGRFGPAKISADGCVVRTIDPLEVGWNHCNAVIICHGDKAKEHRVTVCPTDGRRFTILGFGYTLD